jgi:hypothetical protein
MERLSASYETALNACISAGCLMANIQMLEKARLPLVPSEVGVCLDLVEKDELIRSVVLF